MASSRSAEFLSSKIINEAAYKGGIGVAFALAITTAAIRTAFNFRRSRRLNWSDSFLLLACSTLVGSTVLMLINAGEPFRRIPVNAVTESPFPGVKDTVFVYQKVQDAVTVLLWITIYAAKFSVLSFFKPLMKGNKSTGRWWWISSIATLLFCAICMVNLFVLCSTLTSSSPPNANGNSLRQSIDNIYLDLAFDITTYILVFSVHFIWIWKYSIITHRKLALWLSLLLCALIIAVSTTRAAGLYMLDGELDGAWLLFWLQQEASVAVIAVSLGGLGTSFMPGSPSEKLIDEEHRDDQKLNFWERKKTPNVGIEVSSPYLSGVRTVIHGGPQSSFLRPSSRNLFLPAEGAMVETSIETSVEDAHSRNFLINERISDSSIPGLRLSIPQDRRGSRLSSLNKPSCESFL